jgi:hypothetical protein
MANTGQDNQFALRQHPAEALSFLEGYHFIPIADANQAGTLSQGTKCSLDRRLW